MQNFKQQSNCECQLLSIWSVLTQPANQVHRLRGERSMHIILTSQYNNVLYFRSMIKLIYYPKKENDKLCCKCYSTADSYKVQIDVRIFVDLY